MNQYNCFDKVTETGKKNNMPDHRYFHIFNAQFAMGMSLEVKDTFNQFKIGVLLLADRAGDEVPAAVTAIRSYTDQVVVLSTHSGTDTYRDSLAKVIDCNGVARGSAMKRGFDYLQANGCQYVITLPVNEGYHISDMARLATSIVDENTVIAGTREGVRSASTVLSDFWCKVETGRKIRDTRCTYRLYPLKVLSGKHLYSIGREAGTELLVGSLWRGADVVSLPLSVSHRPADSAMGVLQAFILHLVLLVIAFIYIKPRNFFRRLKKKTSGRFSTTCFSVRMSPTS